MTSERRAVPAWADRLSRVLRPVLIDKVERDHLQPDNEFRRRRIVVSIALVIGATLLGFSLAVEPGDNLFYVLTLALAAVWVIGGFASGRLHLGYIPFRGANRRPIVTPILLGLAAAAIFVIGALFVREIPFLRDYTQTVLDYARYGSLILVAVITILNGIAEEIFFRGGLYAAIGRRHPVLISTVVYAVATLATGNPMLVFAAVTLGAVLGLQRRASGGILGPILTHITWSTTMLLILPPLFGAG